MPPVEPRQSPTAKLDELLKGKARTVDEEEGNRRSAQDLEDDESDIAPEPVEIPAISGPRIEELPSDEEDEEEEWESEPDEPLIPHNPTVPDIYTDFPILKDKLVTETSKVQNQTIEVCLPFLRGSKEATLNIYGIQPLFRKSHVRFLNNVVGRYPAPFQIMDASRPWMWHWTFTGLSLLGEKLDDDETREAIMCSAAAVQHPEGGFGGTHGMYAHLAPTYAALLSLATAGGNALDIVDRKAMHNYLGRIKQENGAFTMTDGGEIDTRGAYCALTAISLLNLPLELPEGSPARRAGHETFIDGLGEWIGTCQTYEGGIGALPAAEAHGAYTFCALACLCILGPPHETIPKYLDLNLLIQWLSERQYAPEGGLAGRTNKLVDGCYSWWIGGCWALVETALAGVTGKKTSLFNREGLIRYIMGCAQGDSRRGGLRDKPGKSVDGYHTCYNLAGLNEAQYEFEYKPLLTKDIKSTESLPAAFGWTLAGIAKEAQELCEESDMLTPIHPVFVIPFSALENARRKYENAGLD